MSVRFNISSGGCARFVLLCSLGISGLAVSPLAGRPIEFSEPSKSALTADVSGLGVKPLDLPSVEDRVFTPHSYKSSPAGDYNMRPSTAMRRVPVQNNRPPGLFDQPKNWTQMTPDEMMQSLMERDTLKLPSYGANGKSSEAWSLKNRYNLQTPASKNDLRNNARATNRLDAAAMNANDPFASYYGRRNSPDNLPAAGANVGRPQNWSYLLHGNEESSPGALRERKAQADRQDDFRRTLNLQPSEPNSPLSRPAVSTVRGNDYVSRPASAAGSSPGRVNPLLNLPSVPTAPTAPLAPGQTSLTPSPYSPPTRAKPVILKHPAR